MKRNLWQNGGFVGALMGGLGRGIIAFFNLHGYSGEGWWFVVLILCIPSVLLGALCGGLAGASRTALRGTLWGGLLSGLSFAAFVIPIAWLAELFHAANKVEQFSLPYLLQRVVLGAVLGGLAVFIGQRGREQRNAD